MLAFTTTKLGQDPAYTMSYQSILLEQPEAGIYLLTINRPQVLNALAPIVIEELNQAFTHIGKDKTARCVLVTGAGEKSFVAGADISQMKDMDAFTLRSFSLKALATFRLIEDLHCPVIALVNGFALGGGCELAIACDWIIASEKAQFGQPEVNLGICAGFGGTQRLPRLVGKGLALEMLTTARMVKADEALRVGLCTQVVPAAELLSKGLEQARLIASKAPRAVEISKAALHTGYDLDLENALRLEADNFALLCTTQDKVEGMTAFLEKRKPNFSGT